MALLFYIVLSAALVREKCVEPAPVGRSDGLLRIDLQRPGAPVATDVGHARHGAIEDVPLATASG